MIEMSSKIIYIVALLCALVACKKAGDKAQYIVDRSIEAHGGELFENSIVDFDFRGRHYTLERDHGLFTYYRIFEDSAGTYHDILNNDGFRRTLNDRELEVDDSWARRYTSSINSVAYFAYLPFGLNDPPVIKRYLGEEEIKGKKYHKVQITFQKEGGGEDFDDLFVYWINQDTFLVDFFGYSYVSDGGGIRFRESSQMQKKNGLTFSNYHNYKASGDFQDVSSLSMLFTKGELQKLSEINLENLEVKRFR
jgi:hypothetical protein